MRPTRVSLAAAGLAVVPLDRYQTPFNTSLALSLNSAANLTAGVFVSVDDITPQAARPVPSMVRAATTVTVVDYGMPAFSNPVGGDAGGHGLAVGDLVWVLGDPVLGEAPNNVYQVASIVSPTSYTFTTVASGAYTAITPQVITARMFGQGGMTGQTGAGTRVAGNLAFPASLAALVVTPYVAGIATLSVLQGELK